MTGIVLQLAAASLFAIVVMAVFGAAVRLVLLLVRRRVTGEDRLVRPWLDHPRGRWTVAVLALVGVASLLYGWQVEPRTLTTTHERIPSDRVAPGKTVRIVHLSDLHIDEDGPREEALPAAVAALDPDVILMTGDYLNHDGPEAEAALRRLLGRLHAPHGIYAVSGNWDVRSWSRARTILREAGVTLLDFGEDRLVVRGTPVHLLGSLERMSLAEAVEGDRGFRVLLHHTPDSVEEVAGLVDLYLCGHTHGGQVRLPWFGAIVTLSRFWKRYEMGRYQVGETTLYVHRGIGMEGGTAPRVRFLAPPEVALLEVVGQ